MSNCTVFYSWQSDLPNATNRGFIQTALEKAVSSIRNDTSIEVEPVIDRDTIGVPGSPDITHTIFNKIDQAQAFVCDISLINSESSDSRITPNPNVLIELGYAFRTLGAERVVMVFNTAFGRPEQLPFDLKMRRVVPYAMSNEQNERATERKQLEGKLITALESVLVKQDNSTGEEIAQTSLIETTTAIKNNQSDQASLTQVCMSKLVEQLDVLAPDYTQSVDDQIIVDAIEKTTNIGVDFAHLAQTISATNSIDSALAAYRGFEALVYRYDVPKGFTGRSNQMAFDFYLFVGHEFFVMLISFMIRDERWEMITTLLDEDWYVDNTHVTHGETMVPFSIICGDMKSMRLRKQRLNSNQISLRADLLKERHTTGVLSASVPFQQFMDADCFLALRVRAQQSGEYVDQWWLPWSLLYIQSAPRFLLKAYRRQHAMKLLEPLKVNSVDSLKDNLTKHAHTLLPESYTCISRIFRAHPLGDFDPDAIGSR